MTPLYYPLLRSGTIGVQQPLYAPMYRNLMLMVSDINVGQTPEASLYILSDELPMQVTNQNGIVIGSFNQNVLAGGRTEYRFTSHVGNIRDRAGKNGFKDSITSFNPQYLITAVKEVLQKMLVAARAVEFELFRSELSYFGYGITSELRSSHGSSTTSIVCTFSGAFWHQVNEVLHGRLAFAEMEPEHLASYQEFLAQKNNVISASKAAFDRQKAMLCSAKWMMRRSNKGIYVGAYSVNKIDGISGIRSTTDIMQIEPMRLYADMEMLKQHNPGAYADIILSVADATAYARANGKAHRIAKDVPVGLDEYPTDTFEDVGYTHTRDGSHYALLVDKRT
jgi:hypothetical protein